MGRAARRQRKNDNERKNNNVGAADGAEISTPLIVTLPFELVAEILLYSTSPAGILSLSRTCKHFRATLVQNPVATFIWKHVRAQTTPPVPDPTALGFSEPQLAEFIYGGGKCSVCGRDTKNMYISFSARIRLCGNPDCRTKQLDARRCHHYRIPQYALGLPWIEWAQTNQRPLQRGFLILDDLVTMDAIPVHLYYNHRQLLQAENEYNKAALLPETLDEYKQRQQKYVDRLQHWMNGCLELCRWKWNLLKMQDATTAINHAEVGDFAHGRGWDKKDVRDTQTVAQLLRARLLECKRITRQDLEALGPDIETDLARIEDHRKIVKVEVSRTLRRLEVERLYRELDRSGFDCFPSLPQFRKLPTLRMFQDSGLDVETIGWKNEFVDILVKNDVREWAKNTVQAFSDSLGYPAQWPSTSTKLLPHPVHWISTRFICTRCSKAGPKATRNKSLTFREAAQHSCLVSDQGNDDQWSPKNFIADVKASAVITRFATAVGMDIEEQTAADLVGTPRRVMCLSCLAPIVMEFDPMIRHSHRHDDMQFMILTDEDLIKFADYPLLPGITATLMKPTAQELRSKVYFGCKHCIPNPLASREVKTPDGKAPKPKGKPKAFSFDGLRSHLKEKHKVTDVADEDVFAFDQHLEELGHKHR